MYANATSSESYARKPAAAAVPATGFLGLPPQVEHRLFQAASHFSLVAR